MNCTPLRLMLARATACVAILAVVSASAEAALPEKPTDRSAEVRELSVRPAAPPVPALKYSIRVPLADASAGNAAPVWLQARQSGPTKLDFDPVLDALDAKPDPDLRKFKDEAYRLFSPAMDSLLYHAARLDGCAWNIPWRERGFATLMPFLSTMREMSNYAAVRGRLAALEGVWDEYERHLQINDALSADVERDCFLLGGLVAIGIRAQGYRVMLFAVERPGAPNYYWALTMMPRPVVNYRAALDSEFAAMSVVSPLAKALRENRVDADALARTFRMAQGNLHESPPTASERLAAGAAGMAFYPAAREWYASWKKVPAEDVDKLDPLVVLATYMVESFDEARDELFKLTGLPMHEMLKRGAAAERDFQKRQADSLVNPMTAILPSIARSQRSWAQVERTHAAMQNVEAIRAYAAAHDGKLPATLSDITDTPPLKNPATDATFDYAVEGNAAVLSDPAGIAGYPLWWKIELVKD